MVVYEKKEKELTLIPKYEFYMEYMLEIVLLRLPRTEKYSIGTEFKLVMYETLRDNTLYCIHLNLPHIFIKIKYYF